MHECENDSMIFNDQEGLDLECCLSKKRKCREFEDFEESVLEPLAKKSKLLNLNEILPPEIVSHILEYAGDEEEKKMVLRFVCTLWKDCVSPPRLYFTEEFGPLMYAIKSRSLSLFSWFWNLGYRKISHEHYLVIGFQEEIEILKFIYRETGKIECACLLNHRISVKGNMEVLKWFKEIKHFDVCHVAVGAAQGGHINILIWIDREHEEWKKDYGSIVAREATIHGHLHILEWLKNEKEIDLNGNDLTFDAAINGKVNILEWLKKKGLLHRGEQGGLRICNETARYGHLSTLKWLVDNCYDVNADTCAAAAQSGDLDTLRWLREEINVPWDERVYNEAHYHIDIIKYAASKNCPIDPDGNLVVYNLANHGNIEGMRWALQNGFPLIQRGACLEKAIGRKSIEMIELLHQYMSSEQLAYMQSLAVFCIYATRVGFLEGLRWFYNNNYILDKAVCEMCARNGKFQEIVDWLQTLP